MAEGTTTKEFHLVYEYSDPDSLTLGSRSQITFPTLAEAEAERIEIEESKTAIKVIGIYDDKDEAQDVADKPLLNPVIVMRLRNAIIDSTMHSMLKPTKLRILEVAVEDAQSRASKRQN